jgi:hypothetical protein
MEEFAQMLMYTVPSVIVGAVAYLLAKKFIDREHQRTLLELRKENQKYSAPLVMQGYERLMLLLERSQIPGIISRVHRQGMSARLMQNEITTTIRAEFDHNITQQLYVSKNAWEYVKKSRDESIKLVNMAATKVNDGANALEYSRELLTMLAAQETDWNQKAIEVLRSEFRKSF